MNAEADRGNDIKDVRKKKATIKKKESWLMSFFSSGKDSTGTGIPAIKHMRNLTPEEKKRLKELKKELAQIDRRKADTAQRTIPFEAMYKDGICKVSGDYYTKMVRFYDINYQLAKLDDQKNIFSSYCEFLNYFDPSITIQFSFVNEKRSASEVERNIEIKDRDDEFGDLREELSELLRNKLMQGNNGMEKSKYITFGIHAKNLKEAKSRLDNIENAVINNFKQMGARSEPVTGEERLKVMYGILNDSAASPFIFSYPMLAKSGLSVQDFIAPPCFDFRWSTMFKMGERYAQVTYLQMFAEEFKDKMLADFLNIDDDIVVNIHIKAVDHVAAIKEIKRSITTIQSQKIDEQKKAVRAGFDMDLISSDLQTYGSDADFFLQQLTTNNQNMFIVSFIIMNTAPTKQKLKNIVENVSGIAQKYNCNIHAFAQTQEKAMYSSLPLGVNLTGVSRQLLTDSTAIFVPFTTQELFQSGEALYYGLNALSNNMILADRKQLKNPNALVLGTPGGGKSFACKFEMLNAFLITDDDIIICDPEGEYQALVNELHGQVISISNKSSDYINPMDVNLDIVRHPEKYRTEGDVEDIDTIISDKSEFLISFCEMVVRKPKAEELDGDEVAAIDQCVKDIYTEFLYNDPKEENMPILEDFLNALLSLEAKGNTAAGRVAGSLRMYVTGSQNVFNHRTNVDMNARVVCFNIRELGTTLRKLGMFIIQNMVWTRVSVNRALKKSTRYYVDEFHLLLAQPQTAQYSVEIWKRFRKWGGIPTGITQNVGDLLISRQVENIFGNSDFVLMLNQAKDDRDVLAQKLNISPAQLSHVNNAGQGEGLISYNGMIIPFVNRYPKDTRTYKVMSTKLTE